VHDDSAGQVVPQVRADTYQVMVRLHAGSAQLFGTADAAEHKQLR
jgi:hypothetical protein